MKTNKRLITLAIAIVFGLTLILTPIVSQVWPVQAVISWTRCSDNPVLQEGDPGDWDGSGVGAACVIRDDATYKMWYTGLATGPVSAIGYATSSNSILWTKDAASNPVLTKGSGTDFDEEGVGSCCVIKEGDWSYKMWYTGYTYNMGSNIPAIGYATSDDGISWTKSDSNPVFEGSPGVWDAAGVLSPCVIKEGDTYKMWYSGRATDSTIGSLQIGYATSTDGVTWEKLGSNPVLAKGFGDWDARGVGVGSVIRVDDTYHMWQTVYKGYGEAGIEVAIGYASSTDGIAWSNHSQALTKGTDWELKGVGAPWVIYDSTYHMWYSGLDTNFNPSLGYAWYTVPVPLLPPSVTDVSEIVTVDGVFTESITAESDDGKIELAINEGTTGKTEEGEPLSEITIVEMEEPPPLPEDFPANVIGLVYDFGPEGTTFDPPITLTFTYDPTLIPEGVAEENMVIAMWDEATGKWVTLEDCSVDAVTHAISAPVSHFTVFTILAYTRPAAFITNDLSITPEEVDIGETVTISILTSNTGDLTGNYEVTLKIDGVVVATKEVTVAGGASQKVTFTTTKDVAGAYEVTVDGLSGTFAVRTPLPKPINWWLIGGIIAGCIIIGAVIWLTLFRRRA